MLTLAFTLGVAGIGNLPQSTSLSLELSPGNFPAPVPDSIHCAARRGSLRSESRDGGFAAFGALLSEELRHSVVIGCADHNAAGVCRWVLQCGLRRNLWLRLLLALPRLAAES